MRASRAVRGAVGRRDALEPASSGAAKMSKSGPPTPGSPARPAQGSVDHTQHHRVAGADRDTVHGEQAGLGDDRAVQSSRPALEPASTTTRSPSGGFPHRGRSVGVVRHDRSYRTSPPASRACPASISELVSRISPSDSGVPTARISSPVGTMATRAPGGPRARSRRPPRPPGRTDGAGARPEGAARSRHVLPDRPDVGPGRDRGPQLGASPGAVHVLAHHHGVGARGTGSPVSTTSKLRRQAATAWSRSRRRCRRPAPRCRPSPRRRSRARSARPDRLGGDPPDRHVDRDGSLDALRATGLRAA